MSVYLGNQKVSVDVYEGSTAPVLQQKTATQNGVVLPDSGYDGLSQVMVNVSGGGVTLFKQSDWDALTTAQKQAYGLVAIQKKNTGYKRGDLVYGADYVPIGLYLPNSDIEHIICEAFVDNFISNTNYWGYGDRQVVLSNQSSYYDSAEDAITIPTKSNGTLAYVDFGMENYIYTAYIVGKIKLATGTDTRLLSSMMYPSVGNGMLLYGSQYVIVGNWGSADTSSGIASISYFAAALQYGGPGSGLGVVRDANTVSSVITKSPSRSGQYLTVGRTNINPDVQYPEPTDMYVRYLAVVNEAEPQQTILANLANLASEFL